MSKELLSEKQLEWCRKNFVIGGEKIFAAIERNKFIPARDSNRYIKLMLTNMRNRG